MGNSYSILSGEDQNDNNQSITWNILNQTGSGWMGFRNITPRRRVPPINDSLDGTWDFNYEDFDSSLPGNARYWWMQNVMGQIFGVHPNWTRDV